MGSGGSGREWPATGTSTTRKGAILVWGLPLILRDEGVSVGTMLLLVFGLIFVLVGIIAEQVAQLRRAQITED